MIICDSLSNSWKNCTDLNNISLDHYEPLVKERLKSTYRVGYYDFTIYHFLMPCSKLTLSFSIAVRDRMVPPPPPPHHLYAKANTSSSIFLHWRRPAFTTAQIINYTIRCNPVGLQNASLVLYLQTYVASIIDCFLCSPPHSYFLPLGPAWASPVNIHFRTYLTCKMSEDFASLPNSETVFLDI